MTNQDENNNKKDLLSRNIFSRLFFIYVWKIYRIGIKKPLKYENLYNIPEFLH